MPDQQMIRGIKDPSFVQHPVTPIRDLYQMFRVGQPFTQDLGTVQASPMMDILNQKDPLKRDIDALQTSLEVINPFLTSDGIAKYGYSDFLNYGDNEDRYAQGFRRENPNKFYSGFNPLKHIYKGIYWGGGFLEKTLEGAVIKTGQGLSSLYGLAKGAITNGVIGNTQDLISGKNEHTFADWIADSTDNMFSNFFDGWDEWLKGRYHYYQEASDRNKKGFVASLGDGDFWMNDVSDGLSFLVSAAFEVGLISKIGLGAKTASRLAPLAKNVSSASEVANGLAKSRGFAGGLEKAAGMLGVEGGGHAMVKSAVDLTSQTLALTAIESAVEANEVKKSIYNSLNGRINPETGLTYTQDERRKLSAEGAAQVFRQNMAVLAAPKFLETLVFNRIGKAIKSKFNAGVAQAEAEAGKASGRVLAGKTLKDGVTYKRAGVLSNLWKTGSAAPIGFLSEGLWEENVQLAISREAEDAFGLGEYWEDRPTAKQEDIDKAGTNMFSPYGGDVGKRYMRQLDTFFKGARDSRFIDDEISKSVGIGGAFGIIGGGVHGYLGLRQQAKVDQYWERKINTATTNLFEGGDFFLKETKDLPDPQDPTKTKPQEVIVTDPKTGQALLDEKKLQTFFAKMDNMQGILDIIGSTEDTNDESNKTPQKKELNKLARNVLFTNLAMEYIRAGKKDVLLANLASVAGFSDKDIEALGYEPGTMSPKEKKEVLSRMTKIVERLARSDEWIENNVIDNVSEPRQGFMGIKYTKTQKEKRRLEFEAKKAYLRGLAMQSALLDNYLDEIADSETNLPAEAIVPEFTGVSIIKDKNGNDIVDPLVSLDAIVRPFNSRIPALRNMIKVLKQEIAYHMTEAQLMREAPKAQKHNPFSKTAVGTNLNYNKLKTDEAYDRLIELENELDRLLEERNGWLKQNNENFHLVTEDGQPITKDNQAIDDLDIYVAPKIKQKQQSMQSLEDLEAEKQRRINEVKKEEIGMQKAWINQEWQLTAALKEEKSKAGREETYFSRRMSLSQNAYNTYFQREVMDRDDAPGQRKMQLFHKDESKRVTAKKYKKNEEKLLNAVRIEGKLKTIIADINGKKLLAEIQELLNKDLPSAEFAVELKTITDKYTGLPMIIKESDKALVDEHIEALRDEYNFVSGLNDEMGGMPDDERFNDKYYDIDANDYYVLKPQYDDLVVTARLSNELRQKVSDMEKIKSFLAAIPNKIEGDWNNTNRVRRRIADVYTESADSIITSYNQASNNGQSELSGDLLSTKQDLDKIEYELDELKQLKVIFEDRHKTDMILAAPEFRNFIEDINKRIEDLEKIKEIVKERMSSRLRENQDFLIDSVNNVVEQLGLNFDGTIMTPPLHDEVVKIVGQDAVAKLTKALTDLKAMTEQEDQDKAHKQKIADTYWEINGQVAAIQELIKSHKDRNNLTSKVADQKKDAITRLENTSLMKKIKGEGFYREITDNINDSLLGALQVLFYNTGSSAPFSQVGLGGADPNFLDDQPSSPVYKFREEYNLRKFIRAVEKDNSRTADNTNVSKDELLEFLKIAREIQNYEDLQKSLDSELNMPEQIEKEKQVVNQKKDNKDKKDTQYDNLIVSSIQQVFFIRNIANFLRRKTGVEGFSNWAYIQAPGGAGKTQTLGTWFNIVSGITRDKVLATAFTEEASRSIKKALLVGETGPKDAKETAEYIANLTKNKKFDHEVLIIDEFPAIDIATQKELFDAIHEYSKAKEEAGKGEFKVIAMGDTNQLTFNEQGLVSARPGIINNPNFFNGRTNKDNKKHPAKMNIIPSLTVNFRSNLFAITSFIEIFKGSSNNNVNSSLKVTSSDVSLEGKNVKGVVSVDKTSFKDKMVSYIKKNSDSTRTRTLIVNESKIAAYKKLLEDSGIKVITDPNDELTKGGIYLTTVKNVQGFSFDEVFIDFESSDKDLFGESSNPNYNYNKAMYVATSRARNLIVVTNFSNFENVEDTSIESLESKALDELQTKDDQFIANRDSEIKGGKDILGSEYDNKVKPSRPAPSTKPKKVEPVQTPLDKVEEIEEKPITDDESAAADKQAAEEKKAKKQMGQDVPKEEPKEEEEPEQVEEEEDLEETGPEVPFSDVTEELEAEEELVETEETPEEAEATIMEKIRDTAVTAWHKIKDSIIELLFPTGQTMKFKIEDGVFSIRRFKVDEGFQQKAVQDGDEIMLIPFIKNRESKANRKFGYAIVAKAIDDQGEVIEDEYRTVAVLSDNEIEGLRTHSETNPIYQKILENETRDEGFVSIRYEDIWDEDGFTTGGNRIITERDIIATGKVVHANPIRYFYSKNYRPVHDGTINEILDTFVDRFYKNHLDNFGAEGSPGRLEERNRIRELYNDPNYAQIVIPVNRDLIPTRANPVPRLKVPPELRDYVKVGRPYLVIKPIHERSDWQFIGLSRKVLNKGTHNEVLEPINEFIRLGKEVRDMLYDKGIPDDFRIGYSKSMSSFLGRAATAFRENSQRDEYDITFTYDISATEKRTMHIILNNAEMQRVANFYSLFSRPSGQFFTATTEQDLVNLTRVTKSRTFVFDRPDNGGAATVTGKLVRDEQTREFFVEENRTGVRHAFEGPLRHGDKMSTGDAQQALNNIMQANSHIARFFSSEGRKIGFATPRGGIVEGNLAESRGYKFMSLLGTKTGFVVKRYNEDGTAAEFYEDIFDILETLFTFEGRGEIPAKTLQYVDDENQLQSMDVQFRVPVPITREDEDSELSHDYSFGGSNTSRNGGVVNSKYFETNFEDILPTRAFITFEKEVEPTEVPPTAPPVPPTEELIPTEEGGEREPRVGDIVRASTGARFEITSVSSNEIQFGEIVTVGTGVWTREEFMRRINEGTLRYERAQQAPQAPEPQVQLPELTREEIERLPLTEIRNRMTPQQRENLENYVINTLGYTSLEEFYQDFEDPNIPADLQDQMRSYIIDCIL